MGPLGLPELFFILLLALLLFGPRRLPELGRSLGRGLAEFRRASSDLRSTIEEEIHSIEREASPRTTPPAGESQPRPAKPSSPDRPSGA